MAKVSPFKVKHIRSKFKEQMSKVLNLMLQQKEQMLKLDNQIKSLTENFFRSEYSSTAVSKYADTTITQLEAMRFTHTAIAKCQALLGTYRLFVYPKAVEIHNDSRVLYDTLYITFMNDDDVVETYTANTDKVREVEFQMLEIDKHFMKIKSLHEEIQSYGKFAEEQQFSLNRIDTMIRSVENMRNSEMFSDTTNSNGDGLEIDNLQNNLDLENTSSSLNSAKSSMPFSNNPDINLSEDTDNSIDLDDELPPVVTKTKKKVIKDEDLYDDSDLIDLDDFDDFDELRF
ncbi:hypothetical protein ThvES_00013420 [Thiovulum sp. ES]|nr:hypothetical protein ThvES_00013420 [Thiovulum sp. ES]